MKILEYLSYLLILAAAVSYMWVPDIAAWLMALGALGVLAGHLHERYSGDSLRKRRIMRLRYMLPLFYGASAWFMFKHEMEWAVMLLIAVVLELYTILVTSRKE